MQVETFLEHLFFTTVYIETSHPRGAKASGTGFIYNVETGENQHAGFVATNKHVIEGAEATQIRLLAAKDQSSSEPSTWCGPLRECARTGDDLHRAS